jgi:CRP-like cAMP-binding protein
LVATQDTICLTMTREAFSKVVDQFPQILITVTRAIGQRVLMAERKNILEIEEKGLDLQSLLGISLI